MARRPLARLKSGISDSTVEAVKSYLRDFASGRCVYEHFDGKISVYFDERSDFELLMREFPDLIEDVREPSL